MSIVVCDACGHTFDVLSLKIPFLQMELFTGGNVVRKCPKCGNKIKVKIKKGDIKWIEI